MTDPQYIFPLGTVLFPGGLLPLRIFEQRYIEMTKVCIRDNRPFGVCLIREGREVGEPALPERVGCLATIDSWEMPQLGIFHLIVRGTERFRLLNAEAASNGLLSGAIELLAPSEAAASVDRTCRDVLKLIIERVGADKFPAPVSLDDADWVSYRLAEVLPFDTRVKQQLLELESAHARLERLRELLVQEGLAAQDQHAAQ